MAEENKDNQLYELLLPKLPFDVLGETLEVFDVKLVEKKTEKGNHVLQGSLEEVTKAKDFIYEKLQKKVESLERK